MNISFRGLEIGPVLGGKTAVTRRSTNAALGCRAKKVPFPLLEHVPQGPGMVTHANGARL